MLWTECLHKLPCPPTPTPYTEDGALGVGLDELMWVEPWPDGISALWRDPTQLAHSLFLYGVRTQQEGGHHKPGREFLPKPDHANTLISDF